jgi:hypothetical protein
MFVITRDYCTAITTYTRLMFGPIAKSFTVFGIVYYIYHIRTV